MVWKNWKFQFSNFAAFEQKYWLSYWNPYWIWYWFWMWVSQGQPHPVKTWLWSFMKCCVFASGNVLEVLLVLLYVLLLAQIDQACSQNNCSNLWKKGVTFGKKVWPLEKRLGLWKKGVKSKLLTTIEKMVKGGARNFAKPSVDPGLVLKILKDNAEVVKDLGAYETVSRASAVQPHGLLQVRHLLEDIIEVSPTCELQASVLRTALMNLLTSNISLNNTQFNGNTWSNQKAERITVLLCHTRKVARDK